MPPKKVPGFMEDAQVSRLLEALLAQRLDPLLKKVDELMAKNAELEYKYESLLEKFVELQSGNAIPTGNLSEMTEEIKLRVLKANNVVVSGIVEPKTGSLSDRENSDKHRCEELLQFLNVDSETVKHVSRIGKPQPNKMRLLRVEFKEHTTKSIVYVQQRH